MNSVKLLKMWNYAWTIGALLLAVELACARLAYAEPPSAEVEATVVAAFTRSSDGWSADEVLLDDERRGAFLEACTVEHEKKTANKPTADEFCEALLHLRKSGGKLPESRRQSNRGDQRGQAVERCTTAAEMAARQLQDALDCHTDSILVNTKARERFDEFAKSLAPDEEAYAMRKAAIRLRKTRRLEPELLSRVTDWKRRIRTTSLVELRGQLDSLSERPGIYIFRDATGYLYIGQAANLKERLKQHLLESDRVALANYLDNHLADNDSAEIQIELHEFESGSPGENTRTRRAYESELIRTRKPKLNLAP